MYSLEKRVHYRFNDDNQRELAEYYKKVKNNKNVYLLLSNSNPKNSSENDEFFDELYQDFQLKRVQANRMINSKKIKRGKISEILVSSYRI